MKERTKIMEAEHREVTHLSLSLSLCVCACAQSHVCTLGLFRLAVVCWSFCNAVCVLCVQHEERERLAKEKEKVSLCFFRFIVCSFVHPSFWCVCARPYAC